MRKIMIVTEKGLLQVQSVPHFARPEIFSPKKFDRLDSLLDCEPGVALSFKGYRSGGHTMGKIL